MATDLEDIILSNTKKNLEINNNLRAKNNIKLMPLEWNKMDHINKIFNLYEKIDNYYYF